MITIDILIPSLERAFDFELDEEITPRVLMDEIEKIIESIENVKFEKSIRGLFSYSKVEFLSENMTLKAQGIVNGDRLFVL